MYVTRLRRSSCFFENTGDKWAGGRYLLVLRSLWRMYLQKGIHRSGLLVCIKRPKVPQTVFCLFMLLRCCSLPCMLTKRYRLLPPPPPYPYPSTLTLPLYPYPSTTTRTYAQRSIRLTNYVLSCYCYAAAPVYVNKMISPPPPTPYPSTLARTYLQRSTRLTN